MFVDHTAGKLRSYSNYLQIESDKCNTELFYWDALFSAFVRKNAGFINSFCLDMSGFSNTAGKDKKNSNHKHLRSACVFPTQNDEHE